MTASLCTLRAVIATQRTLFDFRYSLFGQQRTIEKVTFVWADQKLITLDQDGNLMIAHPTPHDSRSARRRRC
jgi:hypothetical protein